MPKLTNENKENLENILNYIGLDLDNIPDFLNTFKSLDYRPTKRSDNTEYSVYRFVNVQDIQILITNANRLTDIKEKYENAKPISEYLQAETEEQIESFAIFLNMLKNTEIAEIKEIEEKQNELNISIPYEVRYEKNYIWQIYYSEYTDRYFMLVPSEDAYYGALFYLLKEQIIGTNKFIYVPIANFEPGEEILTKNEKVDLENYLWLFTKNWPNIYEIMLKDGTKKIVIIGETEVYESIFAKYHIELHDRAEASIFYKQLKALFILQTELNEYYRFNAQIDEDGSLKFYYKDDGIKYEELGNFITKEYIQTKNNIKKMQKDAREITIKLDKLKQETRIKEKEYLEKQKQISTYLKYKRTFFGKVKYFFSRRKININDEVNIQATVIGPEEDINFEEKNTYNIEDLVTIYAKYNKIENNVKNKKLDAEALQLKLNNLNKKVENATLYINEIDSHKKSIFEFWKYSSKDDVIALNAGEELENKNIERTLRKVFDYESDREDITKQIDKLQREELTKEEEDCIYVASTQILPILNKIKNMVKVPDDKIAELLEEQKLKSEQHKKDNIVEYDIFGGLSEDRTKIKILGKNKHRETEKNQYQILSINNDTTLQNFKETLKRTEEILLNSFDKVRTIIDMPIYKVLPIEQKIDVYDFSMYSMNPEDELKTNQIAEDEFNLVKVNLREKMPAIFYTNIMFFDNFNKTLPLGMDKSNNVLINAEKLSFVLKDKKTIYTNKYFSNKIDADKLITKKVHIYEYDVQLKRSDVKDD